jgi:catechol 2,3-dioxygenase-like lactoylglutathione lyase family enzyme
MTALQFAAMEVRNIRWVGVKTDEYQAMVGFLRDVLGLRVSFEEPLSAELTTSEGDQVQVMAPGHPYYDFFAEHAAGPVPLFEVDDVHAARRELEAAGVELIGTTERDSNWEWIHVRAPDGNLYELASRL